MEQRERESTSTQRRGPTPPPQVGGRSARAVLFLGGLACSGGAALLVAAPMLHPAGEWAVRRAAELGVNPGILAVVAAITFTAGVLLAAQGRASRRLVEGAQRGEELSEKVGGQVVALRRSLHDFRAEVVWLREAMTGLAETVRDHVARSDAAHQADVNKEDAIFRIAASLDQLGARVEGRIHRIEGAQHDALTRLEVNLEALTRGLESALEPAQAGWHPEPAPEPPAYSYRPAPSGATSRAADYGDAFEEPFVAGADDLEIEVTLEEPQAPLRAQVAPQETADGTGDMDPRLFETSLGLLDAFDEYGDYRPPQASAKSAAAPSEPPAPLPGPTRVEQTPRAMPAPSGAAAPTAKPAPPSAANLRLSRPKPNLGGPRPG